MRKFLLVSGTVGVLLAAAPPAFAQVSPHLHCLTNSAGTHAIAGGVTANAPQHAFENVHFNVHLAVFMFGPNPNTVFPVPPTATCP
jgi:hypothetical protein